MSFLKAYTQYGERLTDAPPLFHLYVGMGLLAAALGNGCWVSAWGRRVCANLWIILLAPSGMFRKTTAVNIGAGILTEALPGLIYPSEWSFEALQATMASKPSGVLMIREFRRFFQALGRDYAGGSKELLVDAFDNPELDVRRTKLGGETVIKFPAPSILAATTSDWFEKSLQEDDVGGGVLSRMVMVRAEERGEWRGLGAMPSDADHHQRQSLCKHLKAVNATMRGQVDYSQIREPFNAWLQTHESSWFGRCSPELAGTIARSGANALKLTMIFQADAEPSTVLSPAAFERARQMVEDLNERTAQLLDEGLGHGRDAKERQRIAEAIRGALPGALEHSVALRSSHLSARAFQRHIETLVEAAEISVETVRPESGHGKASKGYRSLNGARP